MEINPRTVLTTDSFSETGYMPRVSMNAVGSRQMGPLTSVPQTILKHSPVLSAIIAYYFRSMKLRRRPVWEGHATQKILPGHISCVPQHGENCHQSSCWKLPGHVFHIHSCGRLRKDLVHAPTPRHSSQEMVSFSCAPIMACQPPSDSRHRRDLEV